MPLDGVCSANHMNTQRTSKRESKLEFSWLQEQTPATANWPMSELNISIEGGLPLMPLDGVLSASHE